MKRLFIDLDICSRCKECSVCCDNFYHPQNNGITGLREYATFAVFCRHCEAAPCVNSCYHDALERQDDSGHLKRHMMLCTSCKTCSIACPFGTILPDFIPYLDSGCDFCAGADAELPSCVSTCPEKAVDLREVEEDDPENNIFLVGDKLAVRTRKWERDKENVG